MHGRDESQLPALCETCLGPSPFLRMQRLPLMSECHVCKRPMTAFRFQPGPQARYKKTVICKVCSDLKNACQCCINDLTYNIPLKVRDRILAKYQSVDPAEVPRSEKGMRLFAQNAEAKRAQGLASGQLSHISPAAHAELMRHARKAPDYSRNQAKLCFHFLKGTCTRGAECPYRHEFPPDWEENKEFYTKNVRKSIKDRFFGTNDQVADRWIEGMERREEEQKQAAASASSTLVVMGLPSEGVTVDDIKDSLYGFGEIVRASLVEDKHVVFVEFAQKLQATEAMAGTRGKLMIDGHRLRLAWATSRGHGSSEEGLLGSVPALQSSVAAAAPTGVFVMPPPAAAAASSSATPGGYPPAAAQYPPQAVSMMPLPAAPGSSRHHQPASSSSSSSSSRAAYPSMYAQRYGAPTAPRDESTAAAASAEGDGGTSGTSRAARAAVESASSA